MNNHEYIVDFCRRKNAASGRFLDYGCGSGDVVALGLKAGLDFYGCDLFYQGGDHSGQVPADLMQSGRVLRMDDTRIPFPDGYFDVVSNNQVMEHVVDLDQALREIQRVLKPGGVALSIFPDRSIWREGHTGIPFLHWFPKGTRPRLYYAWLMRSLGMGKYRKGRTAWEFALYFTRWLDDWTVYRSERELEAAYRKYFARHEHVELEWFDRRVEQRPALRTLPSFAKRFAARKYGGMVLVSTKA